MTKSRMWQDKTKGPKYPRNLKNYKITVYVDIEQLNSKPKQSYWRGVRPVLNGTLTYKRRPL